MKTETLILRMYAIVFIIFSLPAFFIPQQFAEILQFNIDLPGAKMEFVAAYGGLILGVGVFLIICARENPRLGLLAILFTVGSLMVGRIIGFSLTQETTWVQNTFLIIELLTVLLVLTLLSKQRNKLAKGFSQESQQC